jgi:hypothetical protein
MFYKSNNKNTSQFYIEDGVTYLPPNGNRRE